MATHGTGILRTFATAAELNEWWEARDTDGLGDADDFFGPVLLIPAKDFLKFSAVLGFYLPCAVFTTGTIVAKKACLRLKGKFYAAERVVGSAGHGGTIFLSPVRLRKGDRDSRFQIYVA